MKCSESGQKIWVTVKEAYGSTPREAGTSMVVSPHGSEGTIGGGALEWRAVQHARELLAGEDLPHVLNLPLGPALAQCCGGRVTLSFSRSPTSHLLHNPQKRLHLYGAGHVGLACIQTLKNLPFAIKIYDSRSEAIHKARALGLDTESHYAADCSPGDFHLVMTHDHALDLDIVERCLKSDQFGYLGLIGSKTKRARFEAQLRARGLDSQRLVCPIGIAGIAGKEPAVIAASVAAQLLIAVEALDARSRKRQLMTAPE